ncbi:uncharacterized protein LOC130520758 isoform X2 [Takifugu flavidus]|uniref:uncharacterized protein LOC130520758 isoform X2 n=1 Tax=Takifugu flavidus TaxID=433684 RepID=UPI002544C080|nr:uncharacterized protein LOC130520758 isoform X2 [Takifugu flavidus]
MRFIFYLLSLRLVRTEPDVKAVIQVPPSDSVRSVTLQCSVLSDSENTTCRTERNVCWFQSGPDASYPSVFAAHGGRQDGCQGGVRGGAPQKWESSSSELLGSSDAGPFSCAVATCGEFFFGTLNFRTAGVLDENTILVVLLAAALVASVIVNVCLVWILKGKSSSCCEAAVLSCTTGASDEDTQPTEEEMCYSAPVFTRSKAQPDRGRLKDKETVYSEVMVSPRLIPMIRPLENALCSSSVPSSLTPRTQRLWMTSTAAAVAPDLLGHFSVFIAETTWKWMKTT